MSKFYCPLIFIISFNAYSQETLTFDERKLYDSLLQNYIVKKNENSNKWSNWYDNIVNPAVSFEKTDKAGVERAVVSERWRNLRTNKDLRNSVYKENYSFEDIKLSLEQKDILLASWQMICIYPNEREKVLTTISYFDRFLPMSVALVNGFETYAYLDPRASKIENDKLSIKRPDIITDGFKKVQEMINLLAYIEKTKQ